MSVSERVTNTPSVEDQMRGSLRGDYHRSRRRSTKVFLTGRPDQHWIRREATRGIFESL